MEEVKEKVLQEPPRKKRRVSLFKRRKKSDIRPFVREKRKHQYKKILLYFALFLLFLFTLSALLYVVRMIVIPKIFNRNPLIISPQGKGLPDNSQIREIIGSEGLDVSDISFATDSAVVIFTLNQKTEVLISSTKDIQLQLGLVRAINRQMITDGKQAISIDLRYNKPIVKF